MIWYTKEGFIDAIGSMFIPSMGFEYGTNPKKNIINLNHKAWSY